ncbi:MAG TPA: cytochrome c3 family protein [Casimicrobiaceae bacterium]|nr:cytochrome c3 family protein [Casimicrobiaceae bacterium]
MSDPSSDKAPAPSPETPAPAPAARRSPLWVAALVAVVLIGTGAAAWWLRGGATPYTESRAPVAATYVRDAQCAECHTRQSTLWLGSNHDRAMQAADDKTVLGDFNNARFSSRGLTTSFAGRDGKYFITTEGPDGKPAEYEVKYTFGVSPLQQYLVAFPGGRLQVPTVAWDTERKRWFAMYPNERHRTDDPLHWTGRYQNWNLMCSECHSTDVRRAYDAKTDAYDTKWAELNVGCQACHGPASEHVAWARKSAARDAKGLDAKAVGLLVDFRGGDSRYQVEACAPCHSRRQRLTDGELAGRPFLDNYHPALLREGLYYPDGQQLDEVYVWGSFLQSKMYAKGVRCTDCHDAHNLHLKAEGNALCTQCHRSEGNERFPSLKKADYDTPAHHHHAADSRGAQCANCHMPARNYMVIDPRPDHSLRIPRPDLSLKIGTPNACNGCHDKKTPQWAGEAVEQWFGTGRRQEAHYGEIFADARAGRPSALAGLDRLASDRDTPAIVRATALELARGYGPQGGRLGVNDKDDPDALVRAAAATALAGLPTEQRVLFAPALLRDPIKLVRIEAARSLADVPPASFGTDDRAAFERAYAELVASEQAFADMAGTQMNLADLAGRRGDAVAQEAGYRRTMAMDPYFTPAYLALASLLSRQGKNADAESVLRDGLKRLPSEGELHQSLGLLLAEERRDVEAIAELRKATELMPQQARVLYNLGLLQQSRGQLYPAEDALKKARALGDREATYALALLYVREKRLDRALPLFDELAAQNPDNPQLTRMRDQLRAAMGVK